MHTNTTGMDTLERLKAETRDYLDSEHNNQVRGFYDFNGYWTKKNEALEKLDANRREHLDELLNYMTSITIEDLVTWTRELGRQQLKYWTYAGVGRVSDGRKYGLRHAGATSKGTIVKNNWEILQRVRWHVGATLRRNLNAQISTALTDTEVREHIEEIAKSELDSTFWSDKGSRFSNAIFRLEICQSYLIGTNQEYIINDKLAEVARAWLEFKGVSISQIVLNNYAETIEAANEQIAKHEQIVKSNQVSIDSHKEAIAELRATKRNANGDIDGIKLSLAIKLKRLIEARS